MTDERLIAWLEEVDARLPGWLSLRRQVLAELEDGLRCSTEEYERRGLPSGRASQAAVEEFGSPETVVRAFAPELAVTLARAIALGLLRSGPLLGLVWLWALVLSEPSRSRAYPAVVLSAAPLLPLAIVATLGAAGIAVLATGRVHTAPRIASAAGIAVATAVLAGDLVLLAALALRIDTAPPQALPVLQLAAIASVARMGVSAWCAHHCRIALGQLNVVARAPSGS